MNFSTHVCKQLALHLSSDGFERNGRLFYRIKNDLCFCIHIQMPSDLVHVHFFVMPLYIPSEHIYFTYGRRLCYAVPTSPKLYKSASDEEIEIWCNETYQILSKEVLPFFHEIDSPKKLSRFLNRPRIIPHKFFFCENIHIRILKLYTYAYRHKQIAAFFALLRYEISASFSSVRMELKIPIVNGKFSAPAIPQEEFKLKVLKVKRSRKG